MPEVNGQLPPDKAGTAPAPEEARPGTETLLDGESVIESDATPDDGLEPKYRGKSLSDVAKMHKESEAALGKQSSELGELRKKVGEFEQAFQRLQWERQFAAQQAQPTPPPQPHPAPDYPAPTGFDWEKPEQSAARIADQVTRQRFAQFYQGMEREQAQRIAPLARSEAMRTRPDLFKGVEDKVDMAMDAGVRNGWIRPADITNPRSWEMVAWQLQGLQNQYRVPSAITPVSPTMTETPSGIRQASDEVEEVNLGRDLEDAISKGWKEDPKKVAKALTEDRRTARARR